MTENTKIYTQNWDKQYLESCKKGLEVRDINNDGYTTADEMITNNNNLVSVFKNQSIFTERADELMDKQAGIFQKYAGSDGIFSETEYANCINSPEWDETLKTFKQLDKEYQASFDKDNATQRNVNNSNVFSRFFTNLFNKFKQFFSS